jgi:ubiquinone/menaquinone biosynthesis C-methylase UbiE
MELSKHYNEIADNYAIADKFGAISQSHDVAIKQLATFIPPSQTSINICDLGIGTGHFLEKIQAIYSNSVLTGIDISPRMIALAKKRVEFNAIESTIVDAAKHLPYHSQHLIIAHFINAYVPINQLFSEVKKLSSPNGYFSFVTTTYDSFPVAQQLLAEFIASSHFLGPLVGHFYKTIVAKTTVASNKEQLLNTFGQYDFTILSHKRITIPIEIKNVDELARFGIDGTWFLNSLSIMLIPKSILIKRLKRIFNRIFDFPYKDTHIIDIIIAEK